MTRPQAIEILRQEGDQTPHEEIDAFCKYVNISHHRFFEIADTFRNPAVWKRSDGVWKIDNYLIKEWAWA
jgi:hypothetical protein